MGAGKTPGWMFQGLHKTGTYVNWPLIHQCRTEAQCVGCSDPRFRTWYVASTCRLAFSIFGVIRNSESPHTILKQY